MDIFETCGTINDLLNAQKEEEAKKELLILTEYLKDNKIEYSPLVNHLLRQAGLYSLMNPNTANWDDRLAYEIFKDNKLRSGEEDNSLGS